MHHTPAAEWCQAPHCPLMYEAVLSVVSSFSKPAGRGMVHMQTACRQPCCWAHGRPGWQLQPMAQCCVVHDIGRCYELGKAIPSEFPGLCSRPKQLLAGIGSEHKQVCKLRVLWLKSASISSKSQTTQNHSREDISRKSIYVSCICQSTSCTPQVPVKPCTKKTRHMSLQ